MSHNREEMASRVHFHPCVYYPYEKWKYKVDTVELYAIAVV